MPKVCGVLVVCRTKIAIDTTLQAKSNFHHTTSTTNTGVLFTNIRPCESHVKLVQTRTPQRLTRVWNIPKRFAFCGTEQNKTRSCANRTKQNKTSRFPEHFGIRSSISNPRYPLILCILLSFSYHYNFYFYCQLQKMSSTSQIDHESATSTSSRQTPQQTPQQSPQHSDSPPSKEVTPKHTKRKNANKLYNNWPGENAVCCNGRLWFGPDRKLFLLSIILILVPACAFPAQVWPYFIMNQYTALTVIIIVISVIGFLTVLGSLIMTAISDPGIIPRKHLVCSNVYSISNSYVNANGDIIDETDLARQQQQLHNEFGNKFFPPLFQQIIYNNEPLVLKYCYTCQVYRPPRCSHCPRCDNCVEKFDHHCPWTGTCIGKRNYRFFYLFVSSTTIMCLFVIAISIVQLVLVSIEEYRNITANGGFGPSLGNILKRCPVAVLLIIYLFFALLFVGSLCVYHSYLILTNQTTYETIKKKNKFAYSKGLFGNLREFLCTGWDKKLNITAWDIPEPIRLDNEVIDDYKSHFTDKINDYA